MLPFTEIRFRFLLGIKNVKRKKSNFRENFVLLYPKVVELFAVLKIIINILINLIYG